MNIENLFPTPVAFFKYKDSVDMDFINKQVQRANEGNTSSEDKYILNKPELLDLRRYIETSLNEYFMATYNPKNDVYLRITQSWLNWTKPGQHHHKHSHPNSLISGCFYINANKETDKIYFYRDAYRSFVLPPVEWNLYNSDSWWLPVGSNELIFFPSSLTHMVETVSGEQTRISLAFNAFPVGALGAEDDLTSLNLKGQ